MGKEQADTYVLSQSAHGGEKMTAELAPERVQELEAYIERFQPHCERHLAPLADPAGKRVLVLGSGWGTEVLWALRRGASFVLGVDPASRSGQPLEAALKKQAVSGGYEIRRATTLDLDQTRDFDLILSNNVAEHIHGLKATMGSLRGLLRQNGRVAIFADPLFYSSMGSHLKVEPWQHLMEDVRSLVPASGWEEYKYGLNRMTVTDFLGAVRESGLVLIKFSTVPDRNLRRLKLAVNKIGHYPMDLGLEGVSALAAFPEHL